MTISGQFILSNCIVMATICPFSVDSHKISTLTSAGAIKAPIYFRGVSNPADWSTILQVCISQLLKLLCSRHSSSVTTCLLGNLLLAASLKLTGASPLGRDEQPQVCHRHPKVCAADGDGPRVGGSIL